MLHSFDPVKTVNTVYTARNSVPLLVTGRCTPPENGVLKCDTDFTAPICDVSVVYCKQNKWRHMVKSVPLKHGHGDNRVHRQ